MTNNLEIQWQKFNQSKISIENYFKTKRSTLYPAKKPAIRLNPITRSMAYLINQAYCQAQTKSQNQEGRLYTKEQWASFQPNFVPFVAEGLEPNKLVLVNEDWYNTVKSIRGSLYKKINSNLFDYYPNIERIYFIGHGVGGAYAAIASLLWKLEYYKSNHRKKSYFDQWANIKAITFGAPRLGNVPFAKFMNLILEVKRFTLGNDHVPHFPPSQYKHLILGHSETEIWIEILDCDCNESKENYWECQGFDHGAKLWKQVARSFDKISWDAGYFGENQECNIGQSIVNVPGYFIHSGPYGGYTIDDCDSTKSYEI
ncbi:hypothetical protein G9A89_010509 [Geosiphon pyriformis]|nr:hypothetical protein G9A89_010509 [Geosiphon pyriformis]